MSLESESCLEILNTDFIYEHETQKVLEFLRKDFFKNEPLSQSLDAGNSKDFHEFCIMSIPDGCSFKAVNPSGDIVGVMLNEIVHKPPPDAEIVKYASRTNDEKFKKILDLVDAVNSKFDIFTHYPNIDKYIDGKIASVDLKYRGYQIAKLLTDKSFEYMKKNQIQIFHALCSSHYSARACEKLGLTEIFQLRYADLLDANGKQLLNPAKPHVAARVLVKEVHGFQSRL